MMHISIPKPCHEDWNTMTPKQQGRHCNVCCKTVVDFTSMNDEEVQYFFLNKKKGESVCGRFKNEQLQRINITLPYNIYNVSMPLWKQFLTACLLAFSSMLFSCDAFVGNNKTLGVTMPLTMMDDTARASLPIPPPPPIQGTVGFAMVTADTTIQSTICTELMGDIEVTQTVTQGVTIIESVRDTIIAEVLPPQPPIVQPDTSKTIFTGKSTYDSSRFVNPNAIDSTKKEKSIPPDFNKCNNENFITL